MILRQRPAVYLCLALVGATLSTAALAQQQEKTAAKRTLVRAGHVLDVKTGKVSDGQTIVVVGDTHPVDCADGLSDRRHPAT